MGKSVTPNSGHTWFVPSCVTLCHTGHKCYICHTCHICHICHSAEPWSPATILDGGVVPYRADRIHPKSTGLKRFVSTGRSSCKRSATSWRTHSTRRRPTLTNSHSAQGGVMASLSNKTSSVAGWEALLAWPTGRTKGWF